MGGLRDTCFFNGFRSFIQRMAFFDNFSPQSVVDVSKSTIIWCGKKSMPQHIDATNFTQWPLSAFGPNIYYIQVLSKRAAERETREDFFQINYTIFSSLTLPGEVSTPKPLPCLRPWARVILGSLLKLYTRLSITHFQFWSSNILFSSKFTSTPQVS